MKKIIFESVKFKDDESYESGLQLLVVELQHVELHLFRLRKVIQSSWKREGGPQSGIAQTVLYGVHY